jgi:hypothetical protein
LCSGGRSGHRTAAESGRRYTRLRHARDVRAGLAIAGIEVDIRGDAALEREVVRGFVGIVESFAVGCWPVAVGAAKQHG